MHLDASTMENPMFEFEQANGASLEMPDSFWDSSTAGMGAKALPMNISALSIDMGSN